MNKTAAITGTSVECEGNEETIKECIPTQADKDTPCTLVLVDCAMEDSDRNKTSGKDRDSKEGEENPTDRPENSNSNGGGVSVAAIVGVGVGCIALIVLVCLLLIAVLLKRMRNHKLNRYTI